MPDISHIHLDAVGGIAGDMFVAAMLDAFPDLTERVFADITAVLPKQAGTPYLTPGLSASITVKRFGLDEPHRAHAAQHSHGAGSGEHAHDHAHPHGHAHHDHDRIEHFPNLVARIRDGKLSAATAEIAVALLTHLAKAESKMHGVPLNQVHFHELADWDSLMDVVAAASLITHFEGTTWSVSDLPRGRGLVKTAHGLLPVPAPATVEILHGFSWRDDGVAGERVTPTGAAILAHLISSPTAQQTASGTLQAAGTGAGTRNLPGLPNILRVLAFGAGVKAAPQAGAITVIEFDIDDMTGEEIALAADNLRSTTGVLDLTIGQRLGKKGRTAASFRLMVQPEAFDAVSALCFSETSTIGLRWRSEQRLCLPRQAEEISSGEHNLRRKRVTRPGDKASLKVESDDLRAVSGLEARRNIKNSGER